MNLLHRLERLEARVHAQNQEGEFHVCRTIIYDPREWDVDEDEAFARMQSDELDRLVAAGDTREADRDRVEWIVTTIVTPPKRADDRQQSVMQGRMLTDGTG
jgi:hypothetical protein